MRNRRLARVLRKTARERLRRSRNLWKDYKRMRRARWRRLSIGRWFLLLYPVIIVAALGQHLADHELLLLLTLYCTATIFSRATGFLSTLYRSGDLAFFMQVPVSDREFFDYEWPRFLRASFFVWVCSASVFALLAFRQDGPYGANLAAAALAAALQWLIVVVFCVILHLLPVRFLDKRIGTPLYVLGFISLLLPAQWVENLWWVVQLLPTAWVPRVFEKGALNHDTSTLPWIVASVVLVGFLPIAFRRMRREYPRFAIVYPLLNAGLRVDDAGAAAHVNRAESGKLAGTEGGSEIEARAAAPRPAPIHLPSLDAQASGWIERLAWRWLDQRERQIATFLCGGRLGRWSAEWRLGLKIAGAGVLSMFLTSLLPAWVCLLAGAVASVAALPAFGGRWDGLQLVANSGTVGPAYAGLPVSYADISRVLIKVNLVRYLVWAPTFLAYAAAVAVPSGLPWTSGLRLGVEILVVLLSTQWIFVFGHHASGTNDTKRLTWQSVVVFAAILLIALGYLTCVGFFFAEMGWESVPSSWVVLPTAGMFACSWLIWRVYRLLYDRGRIDLMRLPNSV